MFPNKRRRFYIDSAVQGALARYIIVHWLSFVLITSLITLMLQWLWNPSRPLVDHLQDVLWRHGPFLVAISLLLPAFVIDIIRLSHGIVGPVYRLRRAMREVASGKPPQKLSLRVGGFWPDLAGDFNGLLLRAGAIEQDGDVPNDQQAELVERTRTETLSGTST
jgi:hypothetical protein